MHAFKARFRQAPEVGFPEQTEGSAQVDARLPAHRPQGVAQRVDIPGSGRAAAGHDAETPGTRPFRRTGGFDAGPDPDPAVAGARGIPAGALGAPTAIFAAPAGPRVDDGAEVEPPRAELLRYPVRRRVQLLPRRVLQQGQSLVPGHGTAGENAFGDGRGGRRRYGRKMAW